MWPEFLESVELIGTGSTVFDPEVVAQVISRQRRNNRMLSLTERERSVLALIAEGKSNQAIARDSLRLAGVGGEVHHLNLSEVGARTR